MTRGVTAAVHLELGKAVFLNPGSIVAVVLAILILVAWRTKRVKVPVWVFFVVLGLMWSWQLFKYATGRAALTWTRSGRSPSSRSPTPSPTAGTRAGGTSGRCVASRSSCSSGTCSPYIVAAANQTPVLGTAFTLLARAPRRAPALRARSARPSTSSRGARPRSAEAFRPDGYGPYLVASVLFLVGTNIGLILIVPGHHLRGRLPVLRLRHRRAPRRPAPPVALRRSAQITRGARLRLLGLAAVLLLLT